MDKSFEDILEMGFAFHGHKCTAMPLGIRTGLAAMEKLGVQRASNKELFCYLETGPAHAMLCFGDGVQVATGATYGKGQMERLNNGKIGFILIDVKTKKAVRVIIKPEFHKKAVNSPFVQQRKQGVEPKDVPADVLAPLLEDSLNKPVAEMFTISEIFDYDFEPEKGTFELIDCPGCNETVFKTAIKEKDGRDLCAGCAEK